MYGLYCFCVKISLRNVCMSSPVSRNQDPQSCEKAKVLKGSAHGILVFNSTELKSLFFSACHRPHRVVQEAPFSPLQEESRTQLHLYSVKTEADRIIQVTFAMTRVHQRACFGKLCLTSLLNSSSVKSMYFCTTWQSEIKVELKMVGSSVFKEQLALSFLNLKPKTRLIKLELVNSGSF